MAINLPSHKPYKRWARYAGDCRWSKDELINKILQWTPTHGHTRVGQPAKTCSVQTLDTVKKTNKVQWLIWIDIKRVKGNCVVGMLRGLLLHQIIVANNFCYCTINPSAIWKPVLKGRALLFDLVVLQH